MFSDKTQATLLEAAEARYDLLIMRGVSPEEAANRVWDCYERAFRENDNPVNPLDKLFDSKLDSIAKKGQEHA